MTGRLRVAIIGTGKRGAGCFGQFLKQHADVEIAAFCDVNTTRAQAAADQLNVHPHIYKSMEEMGKNEQLDGVVITTPDCFHHNHAIQALQYGWNVLIDKPLATNVKDCREIIDYAKKIKKTVMIGFNLRHHAVLKRLKELIDAGVLGKVFLAENREFYKKGRTYMSRWNRFFSKTGGLWIHKGSHDFDIFNWLLDFPKPLRVASFAAVNALTPQGLPFQLERGHEPGPSCNVCHYKNICPDKYLIQEDEMAQWGPAASAQDHYVKNCCLYMSEKDTHDNGIAIVEYENNIKVSLLESFIGNKTDRIYTLVGDRGMAEVSLANRTITITPRWNKESVTYHIESEVGGHGGADPALVNAFCLVMRGELPPNSTAEHGLLATAIGQAAEISRREHRMVEISEIL